MKIEIGKELPAWTMHTCDLCGVDYYITRTTCKVVAEDDLVCCDCVDSIREGEKDDLIEKLTEQNKQLIDALQKITDEAMKVESQAGRKYKNLCGVINNSLTILSEIE